jgi:succinate dehydrogenase hydrophobic anchor subunit
LYFDAFFGLLGILGGAGPIAIAIAVGSGAAGYGIANDRKWGYWLGVAVSAVALLPYVLALVQGINILSGSPVNLMFAVAQFALLVHPMSRNYQKVWFR